MKKTFLEIIEILKANMDIMEFAYEDYDPVDLDLGEVIEVNQEGGGEGDGEYFESVKHFVDHDIYIKVVGNYRSYNGLEVYRGWQACSEVRPFEKIITVYKNI